MTFRGVKKSGSKTLSCCVGGEVLPRIRKERYQQP